MKLAVRPLVLGALLALASCAGSPPVSVARPVAGGPGKPRVEVSREGDFAPRVDYPEVWQAIAARPGSEHVANTEVVKIVLDRTDGQLYFLQSERWPIHYFFAKRFLSTRAHPVGDETAFNRREYHEQDRRFTLG